MKSDSSVHDRWQVHVDGAALVCTTRSQPQESRSVPSDSKAQHTRRCVYFLTDLSTVFSESGVMQTEDIGSGLNLHRTGRAVWTAQHVACTDKDRKLPDIAVAFGMSQVTKSGCSAKRRDNTG